MDVKATQRLPALDGLRGLAILLVVIWHYVAQLGAARLTLIAFIATLATAQLLWVSFEKRIVEYGHLYKYSDPIRPGLQTASTRLPAIALPRPE